MANLYATFPGTNFLNRPLSVSIHQKYGHHTLAFLNYNIETHQEYVFPSPGSPVAIGWGLDVLRRNTYYGYVNHLETVTEGLATTTRVVCVGTSRRMNETRTNSWQTTSRTSIAREIAKRNRMRSLIHPHKQVLPNWSGGPKTDFQCLQRLAEEIGYQFWADGATVYFLDPMRTLRSPLTMQIPTFTAGENLMSVKVIAGAAAPGTNAGTRKAIYGLDYRTNTPFQTVAGDSAAPLRVQPGVVTTYGEAQGISDSLAKAGIDAYTAKIVLAGHPHVEPTTRVWLDGGALTFDQAGAWLITEVEHEVLPGGYTTYATGVRPSRDRLPFDTVSTLQGTTERMSAVVRDGKNWEASLLEHVNV